MSEKYKVHVEGEVKEYSTDTSYADIAKEYQDKYDAPITLCKVDGKLRELYKTVRADCDVEFISFSERIGYETYRRSVVMMFLEACYHILGVDNLKNVAVLNAIGDAYYCETDSEKPLTKAQVEKIKDHMMKMVEDDIPFYKRTASMDEAKAVFEKCGMSHKKDLFFYRRVSHVNIYTLNGFEDYFYGYMVPSTGCLKYFDVFKFGKGVMLQFPKRSEPTVVREFIPQKKFTQVCNENREMAKSLGMDTVAGLNDKICSGNVEEMILVAEARQEKKIADIASVIANKPSIKFVMIAGPSSSGKTTFSHRLSIQLKAQGKIPHAIALDNYFLDREHTPKDENGEYNFECLEAIDVEQFNKDMTNLLKGERVEMPVFNFKLGKREYKGDYLQLGEDDILVIEGIHGLNDKLSYSLSAENKFKIYISALTQINIDEHNRIATTDGRLIRRIVRDSRTRGTSARETINRWESVRAGEEKNIFPFQEDADVMFNSSLIFELSVLKTYVEPQLFAIKQGDPAYFEAKRLLKFLDYFVPIPSDNINKNSIIREFIGGSCFNV